MKRTSLKRLIAGFFAGSVSLVFMACTDFVSDVVDEVHSIAGSLEMVTVTGGTFNNGVTDMTVSTFAISKYEITQEQFNEVMNYGSSDQEVYGDNYPVSNVYWIAAVEFCNALSIREGYDPVYSFDGWTYGADFSRSGYRLPTEAEWEFAARGGNNSQGYLFAGSNTINDVAWFEGNSGGTPHGVGRKAPNELGLYDMSGNMGEWCHDFVGDYPDSPQTDYTGPSLPSFIETHERVIRGGNFNQGDAACFVNDRGGSAESTMDWALGFRVVRSVDGPVNGVSIYPASLSIGVGGTAYLIATITPPHVADNSLVWESSNPAVATVSATGQVTGVSLGEATITVTTVEGGFTATCAVSVRASADIDGMILVNGGMFNNGVADMTVSSFLLGSCEVTQELYTLVTGTNPVASSSIYGYGDDYPVYNVTWIDAVTFCNGLSVMQGYQQVYTISGTSVTADFTKNGYRLPTEAEWEFAARGGDSTHGYQYAGSDTLGDVAWYENNADNRAHTVGTKAANELGLYDMSGNVKEWCYDWYGGYPDTPRTDYTGVTLGEYRVIRGGSWRYSWYCDLSTRDQRDPIDNYYDNELGFRVARNSDTGTAVAGAITP